MSEQIKIDSGSKTYDIVNQNGELLGQFTFNPSDTNIAGRHAEVVKELNKLKSDMTKTTNKKTIAQTLEEIDAIVYEKIDYIFGANVSEKFFSIMGPFSPMASGQFFVEHVLAAIGQVVNEETQKKSKKVSEKVQKYLSKYNY